MLKNNFSHMSTTEPEKAIYTTWEMWNLQTYWL